MHRRHQHLNIPIEIVRTVIAIAETGSLSKAGERLGLSQPAISSQIRRLQSLIGGSLFVKGANGTTTTELGKLALQARKILEANDQLPRLGGNNFGPPPLRLGLSTPFVDRYLSQKPPEELADVFIHADHSTSIARGLIDGLYRCRWLGLESERASALTRHLNNLFFKPADAPAAKAVRGGLSKNSA